MCFFHLLFLVRHKFGANHQSKPPDDSPAYYEGTCGLRREESIQPCITPAFVARARSNCCCTMHNSNPACWTLDRSSGHTTVQKLSYSIFAASAVPAIPINPLSQLFFNFVRHRSFLVRTSHVGRVVCALLSNKSNGKLWRSCPIPSRHKPSRPDGCHPFMSLNVSKQ